MYGVIENLNTLENYFTRGTKYEIEQIENIVQINLSIKERTKGKQNQLQ